ncbi:MAG TPA: DUF1127 domain-containing protein [Roseiarcus sp.]|nr:DUF1127 domain-containing protein [Roseiarcus sp.]
MKQPRPIAARIFAWDARIALWPARVAAARAAFAQLAAMSARELADIGLTAQDLRDATALPLDADPTAILAARAAEARIRALERRPAARSDLPRARRHEFSRTGS